MAGPETSGGAASDGTRLRFPSLAERDQRNKADVGHPLKRGALKERGAATSLEAPRIGTGQNP